MIPRTAMVVVLLIGTAIYAASLRGAEAVVRRTPLAMLPMQIGPWTGRDTPPIADDIVAQLGVDDYISRQYQRSKAAPISLYAGYHSSQRQGDTIHSPQNCLPGAGWQPISAGRTMISAGERSVIVNRYVVQKGLDRRLVMYWYQGRGRVIADEYRNKLMLMVDAARLRRTNGGLVRLMTPVTPAADGGSAELVEFTTALLPNLSSHLP